MIKIGSIILMVFFAGTAHGSHLEVAIETDGTHFKVISKKVRNKELQTRYRERLHPGFFYVECMDGTNRIVEAQSFPDPTEVYYDYSDESLPSSDPTKTFLQGGKIKLPKAQFILTFPHNVNIQKLRIHQIKKSIQVSPKSSLGKFFKSNITLPSPSQLPQGLELETKSDVDLSIVPEELE